MAFESERVSIILPVHNAALHLRSCLESLVRQTHENIEIIAIDDKSTDASYTILKDFRKLDKRVKVFKNKKHYGLAVCFNRALKKARGQYIAFMDPQDRSSVHRIKTQRGFLTKNPKIAVVGSQCKLINQKDKCLGKTDLPEDHEAIYQKLQGLSLQFESVMINRLLLPKDVLYFRKHTYPFIYIDVFMHVLQYGKAANMKQYLHYRRKLTDAKRMAQLNMKNMESFFKVLGKSITVDAYRPSVKTLFSPLVRSV